MSLTKITKASHYQLIPTYAIWGSLYDQLTQKEKALSYGWVDFAYGNKPKMDSSYIIEPTQGWLERE